MSRRDVLKMIGVLWSSKGFAVFVFSLRGSFSALERRVRADSSTPTAREYVEQASCIWHYSRQKIIP